MLNSKQRAILRSEASKIEAIFQVGKGGVGNTIGTAISDALEARELVKLSLLENNETQIEEIAAQIAEKTGSEVVACIGRKIILYRESSKEEKKKYSKLI